MNIEASQPQPDPISRWVVDGPKRAKEAGKTEIKEKAGFPSLYLISRANGSRSWRYFYQHPTTKKTTQLVLELDQPLSLKEAKEKAAVCRRLVREHRDPKEVLGKLKADVARVLSATWDGQKIDDLFREYLSAYNYKGKHARQETVEYYGARLGLIPDGAGGWKPNGNGVLSKWSGKVYATHDCEVRIDHLEAHEILRDMAPSVAEKTLEALKRFGDWAVWANKANRNPFAIIRTKYHDDFARERELSPEEIKALWHIATTANDELAYPWGTTGQLMLLTLQRPGAVRRARWADFDLGRLDKDGKPSPVWNVPFTERAKRRVRSRAPHTVPLSPAAVALLARLPRGDGDYVFSEDGGKSPLPDDHKPQKRKLDKRLAATLGHPLEPWQWRDLRRTAATGLSHIKIGVFSVPETVIHAIQDHSRDTISATYIKNNYQDDARVALDAWAEELAKIAA